MHEMTFMEMMRISLVMPVLIFLSIILITVLFERMLFFSKNASIDAKLFKDIKTAILAGKIQDAQQIASEGSGLIGQTLEALLIASKSKKTANLDNILGLYYQRIQSLLGRRLGVFGTISFISPLLGLLGTVLGVMTAFRDLALSGSGGPMVVAAGISEALIATAAGIAVAVTAALIYNYFNFKLKHVLNSVNIFGQEIILMLESGQDI